jgi:Cytochrome P460
MRLSILKRLASSGDKKSKEFVNNVKFIPGTLLLIPEALRFWRFRSKLSISRLWVRVTMRRLRSEPVELSEAALHGAHNRRSQQMKFASAFLGLVILCGMAVASDKPMSPSTLRSKHSNELLLPANYRNWVALSSTTPGLPQHQHQHVAGKLYVEPASYQHFQKTGIWPNRTVIVLELKTGKQVAKGACDIMGLEAAVKDDSRFPDAWSYYGIVYDRAQVQSAAKLATEDCADCNHPDSMLTMAFPTLRAMINAKPSSLSPGLL